MTNIASSAPPIDPRDSAELRSAVTGDLMLNVPDWRATVQVNGKIEVDETSAALIAIVARFGEIALQRLNQVPDKNFLAFLDLLGMARLPPQPAKVPLTFSLTPGSITDGVVPAGTQVAAAPAEGEKDPVIFETERELTAVAVNLSALIAGDAERDLLADRGVLTSGTVPDGVRAFTGELANQHIFYIAHDGYFSSPQIASIALAFTPKSGAGDTTDVRALQWEVWDGANGVPLSPTDTTQSLRTAGTIAFTSQNQIPEQTVNGVRSRWLRCRLLTPVAPGSAPAQGMVRGSQLPVLAEIKISTQLNRSALAPDLAFFNAQALDVSKPFFPFGEKPKVGDTLYIGQSEAFGRQSGAITLDVTLLNPIPDGGGTPGSIKVVAPSADLKLKWEVWDGAAWALIGISTPTGPQAGSAIIDDGKAFTKSKQVRFTLPATLAATTVNGVQGNWIRVQIAAGNYGVEADYVPDATQAGGFKLVPATFAPPVIGALTVSYTATTSAVAPDRVMAFNGLQFDDVTADLKAGAAAPFVALPPAPPALYAGFTLPPARRVFPNRAVSLYHSVRSAPYGEKAKPLEPEFSVQTPVAGGTATHHFNLTNYTDKKISCTITCRGGAWASTPSQPTLDLEPGQTTDIRVTVAVPPANQLPSPNVSDRGFLQVQLASESILHAVGFETRIGKAGARRRELKLQYWNGSDWTSLVTEDGTELLEHPGVIEFLGPADFAVSRQFGVNAYWIRTLLESGDEPPVQLRTLLPNTTFAAQTTTLHNEVLGSSDASADQRFQTTRAPVLAGQTLEVREPEPPSAEDLSALQASGAGGVTTSTSQSSEVWVRWIEMPDFHSSSSGDRHYVLDHITGEVRFGDGVQGRIPPRAVANIRLARYQTGGGSSGNRAAGTIVQLKTTVPYIDKVRNFESAEAGVDAEPSDQLLVRGPRTLRNGGRAVTLEDYEDLAHAASPEVERAKTVPLRRLRVDPLGNNEVAGAVSVIIVPRSAAANPLPSSTLMTEVEQYLRSFSTPTAILEVVGPLYVRVDVALEIALSSLEGANAVEQAVRDELNRFLHPLTGGRDGTGWDFGRRPHESDLHAAVSAVPGVDHIRSLKIVNPPEPPPGTPEQNPVINSGRFLVYSGQHQIKLTFVGAE